MSVTLSDWAGARLAARLDADVEQLKTIALTPASDTEVLDLWRELETVKRKLAAVDHAIIRQVQQRNLASTLSAKNERVLARDVLRISTGEANARIKAAEACGPNVAVSGEPLPPIHAAVAAAQAEGVISAAHAALIVRTIDKLPDPVQDEHGESAEKLLVDYAREMDPDLLGSVAQRLTATLNPDGQLKDAAYRRKHRDFTLHPRPDGTAYGSFDATAELAAHLQTLFDALAKPNPEAEGVKDLRTPGQRRHDAVLEALKMLHRARQVGHTGGVTTTVLLTGTAEDWTAGTGSMSTGHGALVPTDEAKRWAGADARFVAVLFDKTRKISLVSETRRLFTEGQRLAMIARDRGCSFPGCDTPPLQCEAHHLTDHKDTGRTDIDDGALLCGWHHDQHQTLGWRGVMINHVPHWIPPRHIDPAQVPRRNSRHDPVARL